MSTTLVPPPADPSDVEAAESVQPVEEMSDQEKLTAWFHPSTLSWKKPDWVVIGFMTFVHAGCFAAPFYFSFGDRSALMGAHAVQSE